MRWLDGIANSMDAAAAAAKLLQSCLTLRDPMDGSLPGSSVCGIFQARVLEGVAIAFSDIHTAIYKIGRQQRPTVEPRELYLIIL